MTRLLRGAVSLLTGLMATLGTSNGILAQQQRPPSDHVAIPVIVCAIRQYVIVVDESRNES